VKDVTEKTIEKETKDLTEKSKEKEAKDSVDKSKEKETSSSEKKEDGEKKESEPTFELLNNPARVMRAQVGHQSQLFACIVRCTITLF